jgi:hypothetical protein
MPSTNGHGPKRADLYRRVSGEEQKTKGNSLPDQWAEQLEYCIRVNFEVVPQLATERLDELEPEERNRVYRMVGLTVLAYEDNKLEARWALNEALCRDNVTLPPGSCRTPGR